LRFLLNGKKTAWFSSEVPMAGPELPCCSTRPAFFLFRFSNQRKTAGKLGKAGILCQTAAQNEIAA
jgi:hypothetical protein